MSVVVNWAYKKNIKDVYISLIHRTTFLMTKATPSCLLSFYGSNLLAFISSSHMPTVSVSVVHGGVPRMQKLI